MRHSTISSGTDTTAQGASLMIRPPVVMGTDFRPMMSINTAGWWHRPRGRYQRSEISRRNNTRRNNSCLDMHGGRSIISPK
jgi:hypothetical protein